MEMEKKVSRSQPQPQDVIDLVEVFHLLLHKWKLLFVAILAGSVLGGAYCTFLLETTYRAEASLYSADRGLRVHNQEPYRFGTCNR